MPVNRLYATWFHFLTQLLPQERITRVRNLAWLLSGIAASRSVCLSHIAAVLPSNAQLLSVVRRLDRFLENPAFRVRAWYEPYVQALLQARPERTVYLIIDSTQVGLDKQWLVVALAYHHRALPVAWDWVNYAKGHSTAKQQLALLRYVYTLIPAGRRVLLVGDAEFGSIPVLQTLEQWGWEYVFRQKGQVLVHPNDPGRWQKFHTLAPHAGSHRWCYHWLLSRQHDHFTNLVAYWAPGARQPWLLVTNLNALPRALHAYRRRMWIEELFGDLKGHGVHFDTTHLRDPAKLSRLAFAVILLFLGCVAFGKHALRQKVCPSVDRRDRRDLSLFQIGWRLIQRRFANAEVILWRFNPFRLQTVR